MIRRPVSIEPRESLEEAARRLVNNGIGCLPVLEEKRLAGIITSTDILHAVALYQHPRPLRWNDRRSGDPEC